MIYSRRELYQLEQIKILHHFDNFLLCNRASLLTTMYHRLQFIGLFFSTPPHKSMSLRIARDTQTGHTKLRPTYTINTAVSFRRTHYKEGRKEGTYLFDQTTIVNTIHIYENAMVRRLSLRLNIAASATATEIIIIII